MKLITTMALAAFAIAITACGPAQSVEQPRSSSGVSRKVVKIKTDAQGNSIEQRLVAMRLQRDNEAGAFKYVYVINTYTGTVMYQSMALGKVVSSSKRLSPSTVSAGQISNNATRYSYGIPVEIGGSEYVTMETLSDDGTYGTSMPYLYWFDPAGNYQQVYASGIYLHISSAPLVVRNATLTMEIDQAKLSEPLHVSPEIEALRKEFK